MAELAIFLSVPAFVWSAWLIFRGPLFAGCVTVLLAMCFLNGELWSVEAAGLDWSIDRFLFIGLCVAFGVQWRLGRTEPKPLAWQDWLLCAFLGLIVVSTFTHDWRAGDVQHGSIIMHLVNGYLIPVGLFGIARFAKLDERQWRTALAILACFGIYLAITAILEIHKQWGLVFPSYIADPKRGIHFGRARGPMLQSARLGLYLITCGAITAVLLSWRGGLQRWGIALTAVLAPLYLVAVYYTYTRSVWIGTVIVGLIIVVMTFRGRARLLTVTLLLASIGAGLIAKGDSLIAFKREYSVAETLQSTQMRGSFAYVSWQMFCDKPLFGFGFGQFPQESRYYLSDRSTSLNLEHIRGYIHHNTFLSLLVEMGIPALAMFLIILFHWLASGWTLYRDREHPEWVRLHGLFMICLLAAYSFQLLFREVSYSPVENSLVFLFAGVTLSLRSQYAASPRIASRSVFESCRATLGSPVRNG
jgi:O-antigen ligase